MAVAAERSQSACGAVPSELRCFVYKPRPGLHLAECIDLDIVARGQTNEEAKRKLCDAVTGHVRVALQGDFKGLLPRPSPFSHRLRYHWYGIRAALRKQGSPDPRLFHLDPRHPASICP